MVDNLEPSHKNDDTCNQIYLLQNISGCEEADKNCIGERINEDEQNKLSDGDVISSVNCAEEEDNRENDTEVELEKEEYMLSYS